MSIVINILLAIHVMVSLFIIFFVLMQRPKSEGLGSAFGGGMTENLFGAGATNALQTITRWLGGIFFGLTLLLSMLYIKLTHVKSPLQERLTAPTVIPKDTAPPAPAAPGMTPPAAPAAPESSATPKIEPPAPGSSTSPDSSPASKTETSAPQKSESPAPAKPESAALPKTESPATTPPKPESPAPNAPASEPPAASPATTENPAPAK